MTEKNRQMEHTDEAQQKNSRQTEDTAVARQARRESAADTAEARQERFDSAEDGLNAQPAQPILTAFYARESLEEGSGEAPEKSGKKAQAEIMEDMEEGLEKSSGSERAVGGSGMTGSVMRQLEVLQSYIDAHPSFQLAGVYTDRFSSGMEPSSGAADVYMFEAAVTGTDSVTDTVAAGAKTSVIDPAKADIDMAAGVAVKGVSASSFNNADAATMAPATAALLSTFPAISDFPEMLRLLEDVRTGKIHCILVGKFTDFCKTRMETVYYIENLFRYLNVRFIAVEEDFDSDREEDMRRIEALSREKMENTRAHNLSRLRCERAKERATRPDAMPSGSAPYGYLVSSDGKSYVVDQEVAPFVRMIFKWAAAGMSSPRIAQRMQLLGVETPGQRRLGKAPDPSKWDAHVVLKILQNPNYTGDIYIGRMQQALYKSQARRRTAPDEWVVRENTHEPLVTREDFKKVQEIIASNDRSGSGRRNASG